MAWNMSTGMCNALLGRKALAKTSYSGIDVSFEDGTGTGGRDRIVASNKLTGFLNYVEDYLVVFGSTSNNIVATKILAVEATGDYIEIPAGSLATEAAGDPVTVAVMHGASIAELFRNCVISLYSGTRPTSADSAEAGTLLVTLSKGGGTFVGGSDDYGINFEQSGDNTLILSDDSDTGVIQAITGTPVATGSALSVRIYANAFTTGSSTSAVRMDGRVGTSGSELNMSAGTGITTGVPVDLTESLSTITLS